MRVGIMTSGSLSTFSFKVLSDLLQNKAPEDTFVGLVDVRPGKTPLAKLKRNFKKKRGFFIFVLLAKYVSKRVRNLIGKPTEIPTAEELYHNLNVAFVTTNKPYSEEFYEVINSQELDVLVYLSGFGIMIKEPLLSITPGGVLSFHHGDICKYRGQPAIFWEIYNNESEMKVTVQKLDAGLDCGEVILEKDFEILPWETFQDVYDKVYTNSVSMMNIALSKVREQNSGFEVKEKLGGIYTLPSFGEYLFYLLQNLKRKIRKILR